MPYHTLIKHAINNKIPLSSSTRIDQQKNVKSESVNNSNDALRYCRHSAILTSVSNSRVDEIGINVGLHK